MIESLFKSSLDICPMCYNILLCFRGLWCRVSGHDNVKVKFIIKIYVEEVLFIEIFSLMKITNNGEWYQYNKCSKQINITFILFFVIRLWNKFSVSLYVIILVLWTLCDKKPNTAEHLISHSYFTFRYYSLSSLKLLFNLM